MRKAFRLILALAVMLTVVLGLGVRASADGLPREKVGYGFGMPEAAAVPAHDLTDEGLTLGGVSFNARIEDGRVYIRIVDLAAVNLLRENADAAEELGLDSGDLYIERGLILVKPDGRTAEEIAGVEAKLAALKAQSAPIGVSVGDEYILASGGVDRLIVEVGELAYPSSAPAETEKASDEAPADTPDDTPDTPTEPGKTDDPDDDDDTPPIEKPVIDVTAVRTKPSGGIITSDFQDKPETTTVYFHYEYAMTTYLAVPSESAGDGTTYEHVKDKATYSGVVTIVRNESDTNNYYVGFDFGDGNIEFIPFKTFDSFTDFRSNVRENGMMMVKDDILAKNIYISVTGDSKGIVKTIKIEDATPDPDEFFKEGSNEPIDYNGPVKVPSAVPKGYENRVQNIRTRDYSDINGNIHKDSKVYGYYGLETDEDGVAIDKATVKDRTEEITTITVKNNVTLVTDIDMSKEEISPIPDIQITEPAPDDTPIVTDTPDTQIIEDTPVTENAPVDTAPDPELA